MRLILRVILAWLGGLVVLPVIAAPASDPPARAAAASAPGGCSAPATPASEAQRKFHPGHYVSVGRAELPGGLAGVKSPGLTGVQMRYRWAELEPQEGQYNFTLVVRDLEAATHAGLQLVAMIEDKSFNGETPTPDYLQSKYTVRNGNQGYTAIRWDSYVNDRLKQLVAKLGAQFDCDPHFEGVAFQETSLGLDDDALGAAAYTPEKYRDALISLLRSASSSLPTSRVFWYMNFLPRNQHYIDDIATAVVGTGVVMGGPDVLPDNQALNKRVYPLYEEFRGRLKLFCSMQHNSYRHRHGGGEGKGGGGNYWSMDDLYLFARDKLHVNYLFWDYHPQRIPPDSHNWDDARQVIARYPTIGS
jgi:hypothetical protein